MLFIIFFYFFFFFFFCYCVAIDKKAFGSLGFGKEHTLFTYERTSFLLKKQSNLSTLGVAVEVLLDINEHMRLHGYIMSAIDIN